ncbi:hypothetical protein [Salipiger bermudensis]|uniref:hypothetical protein n=1 Tax=Salipiger bermudensis TaxID=344736 RepID=UPI001CD6C5C4|nr:hypothetical protein [Salipiger bermudensis]MCA0961174.1 hypothetical protein [Salipiger bermudensis]
MRKPLLISQEAAKARVSEALSLRIGRGKRFSFRQVSDASGIAERTIDSYARGDNAPTLGPLLSLFATLGPGFTSDVLALADQSASGCSGDDPEHMRVLCAAGELVSMISSAVEDGYVDHQEAANLRPLAQNMIDLLEPLAARPVAMMKGKRA